MDTDAHRLSSNDVTREIIGAAMEASCFMNPIRVHLCASVVRIWFCCVIKQRHKL